MLANTSQNNNRPFLPTDRYNLYNFELTFKKYLLAVIENRDTIKNYLSDFRHFSGFAMTQSKEDLKLESTSGVAVASQNDKSEIANILTPELIVAYKSYLVASGLPRLTINRRLSTVRKFCSFCISQGWLKENPSHDLVNVVKEGTHISAHVKKNSSLDSLKTDNLSEYANYVEGQNIPIEQLKKEINYVQEFIELTK